MSLDSCNDLSNSTNSLDYLRYLLSDLIISAVCDRLSFEFNIVYSRVTLTHVTKWS